MQISQRVRALGATSILIVISGVALLYWQMPVVGQTEEIRLGRIRTAEFLYYTAELCEHYHSHFKKRHMEGQLVLDDEFVNNFNAALKAAIGNIDRMKDNKAPIRSVLKSKILAADLEDELKAKGLEHNAKPLLPSDFPKTVADLGAIFRYRLDVISDIINSNAKVTLGRQELYNLQNHMHSLRQIAWAFRVVDA